MRAHRRLSVLLLTACAVLLAVPAAAHAESEDTLRAAAQAVTEAEDARLAAGRDVADAQDELERLGPRRERALRRLVHARAELAAHVQAESLATEDTSLEAAGHEPLTVAATSSYEKVRDDLETAEREVADVEDAVAAAESALADAKQLREETQTALEAAREERDVAVLRGTWEAGRSGAGDLVWPADGKPGSPYGYRTHPITGQRRLHAGTDIPAETGTPIVAAANGTVTTASGLRGYGLTVVISHGDGLETLYAHASGLGVEVGDEVKAGDQIGRVGSTGRSTGPHLHFEVRVDGKPIDPMTRF